MNGILALIFGTLSGVCFVVAFKGMTGQWPAPSNVSGLNVDLKTRRLFKRKP